MHESMKFEPQETLSFMQIFGATKLLTDNLQCMTTIGRISIAKQDSKKAVPHFMTYFALVKQIIAVKLIMQSLNKSNYFVRMLQVL